MYNSHTFDIYFNSILCSDESYSNLIFIKLNAWNTNALIVLIFKVKFISMSTNAYMFHAYAYVYPFRWSELKMEKSKKIRARTYGKWMEWNDSEIKKNNNLFCNSKKLHLQCTLWCTYHMYWCESGPQSIEDEHSKFIADRFFPLNFYAQPI